MVVHYKASDSTYLITAFRWKNTVLPHVLCRREFWLFMCLHLLIFGFYRQGELRPATERATLWYLDWKKVKIISAITTFFEVFYTNQTFDRYWLLYNKTRKLLRVTPEFVFDASLQLQGPEAKKYVRLASRYFMCSLILFVYEMVNKDYVDRDEWTMLFKSRLLTVQEKHMLDFYEKHQRPTTLLHWAAKVIREGHQKSKAPGPSLQPIIGKIVESRQLQQEVSDILQLKVPFQYFHLLKVMITINLVLWAYGMGISESVFAPACFFFAAVIFMGMMELASQLSDPFGEDDTDFEVTDWLQEMLSQVSVVLEYECPFERTRWEDLIKKEHQMILENLQQETHQMILDNTPSPDSVLGFERHSYVNLHKFEFMEDGS